MDTATALPSEVVAVVGVVDPDDYSIGTFTSAWVPVRDFQSFLGVVMLGDLGVSGTIDAKLEQATDNSGTGVKDVPGAAITQLTQAGGDDNKQVYINARAGVLDVEGGYDHIRISFDVGAANSDLAALLIGLYARYAPASDQGPSTIDEIVTAG